MQSNYLYFTWLSLKAKLFSIQPWYSIQTILVVGSDVLTENQDVCQSVKSVILMV